MGKRIINSGHKQNHADLKECTELMEKIESALESFPIDFNKINEVLYVITSPTFKYPNVQKCCETCTAHERNKQWEKALNDLKSLEGITNPDDLNEIFERSRLHLVGGYGYFQDKDAFSDWRMLYGYGQKVFE